MTFDANWELNDRPPFPPIDRVEYDRDEPSRELQEEIDNDEFDRWTETEAF